VNNQTQTERSLRKAVYSCIGLSVVLALIMSSNADIGLEREIMRIRTPAELGALIRDYRRRLRLDQKSLAEKVDVSRQWIVDVEKGKSGAPIGLVLHTLSVLGIAIDAAAEGSEKPKDKTVSHGADAYVDIDSIVAGARKKRK
jgi:HTH-type transcriptional regulator / antitoxin HipB